MFRKLNAREKRILIICGIAAAVIILIGAAERFFADWKKIRTELEDARRQIAVLKLDPRDPQTQKQVKLAEIVPAIEMPASVQQQQTRFQESFTGQLKKAGLNPKRLQPARGRSSRTDPAEYLVLNIEGQGRGQYEQILNLLSDLPNNPHFVGISKLSLKPDAKDRRQLEWDLTVYTYASR